MKTFDVMRICLKALGIATSNSNPNQRATVSNIILKCLYIAQISITFLSTLWYCAFKAESFNEVIESLFYVLHSIFLLMWYCVYHSQREITVSFIAALETKIDRSMKLKHQIFFSLQCFNFANISIGCEDLASGTFYNRIDNEFYLMSKTMFIIVAEILVPCYLLPVFMLSIFKFVSSNYSNDSFQQLFSAT